jgi:hypothetical protein
MPPSAGKYFVTHRKMMFAPQKRHHAPLLFHAPSITAEIRSTASHHPSANRDSALLFHRLNPLSRLHWATQTLTC